MIAVLVKPMCEQCLSQNVVLVGVDEFAVKTLQQNIVICESKRPTVERGAALESNGTISCFNDWTIHISESTPVLCKLTPKSCEFALEMPNAQSTSV